MTETASDRDGGLADEAQRWVTRLASGEMDDAELERFRVWRAAAPAHKRAFEDQRALWRAIGEPAKPEAHAAPRRMRDPERRGAPASQRRRKMRIAMAVAAGIVAAVAFGPEVLLMLRADYRANVAAENVVLPDGSVVALDAGAAIAVAYSDTERRIELLRGDAWFEVAHDDGRPFRVAAESGVIEDIGTAFEVRLDDGAAIVTVTEGVVLVSAGGREGVMLKASERVRYQDDGALAHLQAVPPQDAAAWRRGEILIRDEAPRDAIARIARYRHMPVYLLGDWPEDMRVSGIFRTDRPDEAIGAVARMAGLSVNELAGVILLRPID